MSVGVAPRLRGRRLLFRTGRIEVHSYKVMLYLGCVIGIYASAPVAARKGMDTSTFCLVVVALLVPAITGARVVYVLRHLNSYRASPGRMATRTDGGSALFGGLLCSVAVSLALLPAAGLPILAFWDAASVTMLVGLAITRLGCLMNGCCGGRPTSGWLGMWAPDVGGRWERRRPTQLLEAGWAALILLGVLIGEGVLQPDGVLFATVVVSYCIGRMVFQAMRDAPATSSA
jgi:phosphatidylglycerol:prolipoprotein diacylglycerol transferase